MTLSPLMGRELRFDALAKKLKLLIFKDFRYRPFHF